MVAEGSPWEWGCASCRRVPWGSLSPSLGVLLLPLGRDHPGGVGGAHLALPASGFSEGGRVCHCHPKAPHPSRGQGLVTSHCHQPPPIASTSPTPLGGPGPFVPLPHMAPALLPSAQPGCSGGRIWGTGTSAGGPAMPAAPGGAGGWHLPPTHPGAGSTLCSLSGQLCWLPTCQVPGWGGWLCPGQGHPLGCQRGRDTWRHPETP